MTATTLVTRRIAHRTLGSTHGPITRLMSPADLGQQLKPFIFLDLFSVPQGGQPPRFGMHPHEDMEIFMMPVTATRPMKTPPANTASAACCPKAVSSG